MKKVLLITLILTFLSPMDICSQNQVPTITNVIANLNTSNQTISVDFDLYDEEGDEMEVWIQASVD